MKPAILPETSLRHELSGNGLLTANTGTSGMVKPHSALSPDTWLRDIFACKAVQNCEQVIIFCNSAPIRMLE